MMNTGPPRPGSDPFEDWHHAFNRICRLVFEVVPEVPSARRAVT